MDHQTEELIERLTTENHRLYNENLDLKRKNERLKKLSFCQNDIELSEEYDGEDLNA